MLSLFFIAFSFDLNGFLYKLNIYKTKILEINIFVYIYIMYI